MGQKRKLEHFAELKTFGNVFEAGYREVLNKKHRLFGRWRNEVFSNDQPIVLELGCGKGEYVLAMSRLFPDRNYIGMDIKGARIWRGAKTALEEGLKNIRFLRARIEFVTSFFDKGEVDEIWITFPDPQMQQSRSRKRLTSPVFLERYFQFLKPDGVLHLKTDSEFLHQYTLEVLQKGGYDILIQTDRLYDEMDQLPLSEKEKELLQVRTFYEKMFTEKGHRIQYLRFKRKHDQ